MQINNPFETIYQELQVIKQSLLDLRLSMDRPGTIVPAREIIDRKELSKRLNLSEATLIRYGAKKTIPEIRLGGSVRYCYQDVLAALEKHNSHNHGR